jgi:serine/threonine protein kinase
LYELLAGRRAFSCKTDLELLQTIIHGTPDPLPSELPQPLRLSVEKALERNPDDRYQSMRELVVDLSRASRHPALNIVALPASAAPRPAADRIIAG